MSEGARKEGCAVQGCGLLLLSLLNYLHALLGLCHKLSEALLIPELHVLNDGAHETQQVRHLC